MTKQQIDRINQLAQKAKTPQGLTEQEKLEQQELRRQYVAQVRASLQAQLDNTYVADGQGGKDKLKKKPSPIN